ncbi:MAG: VC0807 family protein [Acidimicrobiales bacterium]
MGDPGEGAASGETSRPDVAMHRHETTGPVRRGGFGPAAGNEVVSPSDPVSAGLDPSDAPDRLRALAPIAIFDVAGPLVVYYGARSAGLSTVLALVLSGVLPFLRVGATVVRHRRIDAIGVLVLSGIALGTVVGLASGSARLYLLDGIVPTVAIGIVCLVSLLAEKPMMYRLAAETMGEDTPRGHAFAEMWTYPEFRRIFRIITVVWGLVFLGESALQAVLVETTSINTAKLTSNLLPLAVFVLTFAWTRAYGRHVQHRSEPS